MIIPPAPSNLHPSLTIFLPTRNESSNIQRKIDEVLGMDYPKEKLSILIIDSESTDKTSEIAKNHLNKSTSQVKWEVVSINTIGKSPAVNHALSLIETDFFVMMDADAICNPISLKLLMDWFEDDKIGAVCGMHKQNRKTTISSTDLGSILLGSENHISTLLRYLRGQSVHLE